MEIFTKEAEVDMGNVDMDELMNKLNSNLDKLAADAGAWETEDDQEEHTPASRLIYTDLEFWRRIYGKPR